MATFSDERDGTAGRWQTMRVRAVAGRVWVQSLVIAVSAIVPCAKSARAQISPPVAADLIKAVVANELNDRVERRKWMYTIEKHEGKQNLMEVQVETSSGPLQRLLAIDGHPIDSAHRKQEDARINRFLHDPGEQLRVKRAHDEDEEKLETLMRLMPGAFLYEYDGIEQNLVRIKFRPNPNYHPANYEGRIVHNLAGSLLVDSQKQRLAELSGQLTGPVEFGYGLLGHIDGGGKVKIGRVQVGPAQWKTGSIDIQLSGRLVLFKTIDKQEYEMRSDFQAVPSDLNLSQANDLIISRMGRTPAARTSSTGP